MSVEKELHLAQQVAFREVEQRSGELGFADLVQQARLVGILPAFMLPYTAQQLRQFCVRRIAHDSALRDYMPTSVSFPVHLFKAEEFNEELVSPQYNAWLGWETILAPTVLKVATVPGDHQSMVGQHAHALGGAINQALRTVAEQSIVLPTERGYWPLLTIQHGQPDYTPIFCIPGAGDHVTGFIDLAEALGIAWPLYGLQPRGLDQGLVPHTSVQAAAAAYNAALNSIRPTGPVHLIGHSFGGWIAFEMANQLQALGRPVASLTLIDSEVPGALSRHAYTNTEIMWELIKSIESALDLSLGIALDQFKIQSHDQQLELLHTAMVARRVMPQRSSPEILRGTFSVFGTALRTFYQPQQAYVGPVYLVLANQTEQEVALQGWRTWAPKVTHWVSAGNHFSILKQPHVNMLVKQWQEKWLRPDFSMLSLYPASEDSRQ